MIVHKNNKYGGITNLSICPYGQMLFSFKGGKEQWKTKRYPTDTF